MALVAMACCLLRSVPAEAGAAGVNGALTVTAANTILNLYDPLVSASATTVTATNITNLSNSALGTLGPGSVVMVYQAQGATITSTNDATYGTVSAYNNSGIYDFVTVGSVSGNVITIAASCAHIAHTYGASAQIVRVPQYTSLTINAGASVVASVWNGSIGGIIALNVAGATTINGTIDASSSGFRGAVAYSNAGKSCCTGVTLYVDAADTGAQNANALAAEKGESIAGNGANYDANDVSRYGRGAPANGGGGGDGHNSGGGGGANGNNGSAWSGQGAEPTAYDVYFSNANAKNPSGAEDPGYAQMTSAGSGGGRGGYSYGYNTGGGAANGGDGSRAVGGLGGRPLTASLTRVFFGGGGGAGDANNNGGGSGGIGGGLVVLNTGSLAGSGSINSNGQSGGNSSSQDAAGGGGGGGSVLVFTGSGSVAVNANGGAGGSQTGTPAADTTQEADGTGGGGGGGFVAAPGNVSVIGGANGTTVSTAAIIKGTGGASQFAPYGATIGETGGTTPPTLAGYAYCYTPVIGAAKAATIVNNSNGTYTVTYKVLLQNYGDTALNTLAAVDNLATTFPTGTTYAIVTAPAVTSTTGTGSAATVDAGFNGSSDTNLVTAGTLSILGTVTVQFVVKVTPPAGNHTYNNSATTSANGMTGNSSGIATNDVSDNGTNADPGGTGNPNQTSENVVTPVSIFGLPAVSKTVQDITATGTSAVTADTSVPGHQLQYVLSFTNTSGEALSAFSLSDTVPLNTKFISATCISPTVASGTCTAPTVAVNSPAGTALKWTFTNAIPSTTPATTYSVSFIVQIL